MKFLPNKYKVHGRNKGRKKYTFIKGNIFDNFLLSINKDIIKDKDIILDIGSGSGENTLFLSKKFRELNDKIGFTDGQKEKN